MIKKFINGIKQRFKDASHRDEFLVWFVVFFCGIAVSHLVWIGIYTTSTSSIPENPQDTIHQRDTLEIVENIRYFSPTKHDITLVNTQTGDTMQLKTHEGYGRYVYMQPGSHVVVETPTDSTGKVLGKAEIKPILSEQVFEWSNAKTR